MRAVVQRVSKSSVKVDGEVVGKIDKGLMVLLGIHVDDTEKDLEYILKKVIGLRIFEDENEQMNLSLEDVNGEILVVSQFTLYGDARKGRRPSFIESAKPDIAIPLYEKFIQGIKDQNIKCESGVFGADMDVEIQNDGPVTILLDSSKII